jgi:hypothetical protein
MKKTIQILSIAIVASFMLMSKCEKDKPQIDDETQTIEDNIISEQEFMRIVPVTNDKAIKQKGIGSAGKILNAGFGFSFFARNKLNTQIDNGWSAINNTNFRAFIDSAAGEYKSFVDSVKIKIDYDAGATAPDGSIKKGEIITILERKSGEKFYLFGKKAAKFTTVVKDFDVNGIKYTGSIAVERESETELLIKVNNGFCKQANWANRIDFANNSERKITWQKGPNHPSNSETYDEYQIEEAGSNSSGSSGKSRDGLKYTMKILKPLLFRTNAKYGIVGGEVELTPEGKKTRIINYEQIDKGIVTFTVDGNTFTIDLKR